MNMEICPTCGQIIEETCAVAGCGRVPDYEGFVPNIDPFTKKRTGLVVRRRLCEMHAKQAAELYGLRLDDKEE